MTHGELCFWICYWCAAAAGCIGFGVVQPRLDVALFFLAWGCVALCHAGDAVRRYRVRSREGWK